eukprot:GFYU01000659.1.p1 GENE.GFYU01000659.1~~GFYU01000659.1.p1  ORF type:complete len:220 (+),score=59.89 GFYU01000659.1:107-766(+)
MTWRENCRSPDFHRTWIRWMSLLSGVGMVIAAGIGMASASVGGGDLTSQTRLGVLSFYLFIFGLLTILAELRLKAVLVYFKFLWSYLGRGIFYIFVATALLIVGGNFALTVVVGIILIFTGAASVIMAFFYTEPEKENAPPAQQQPQQSGNKLQFWKSSANSGDAGQHGGASNVGQPAAVGSMQSSQPIGGTNNPPPPTAAPASLMPMGGTGAGAASAI